MNEFYERFDCRVCHSTNLIEVLSLGNQPPANAFLKHDELNKTEIYYPLSLKACHTCGMLQLGHIVSPELLFREYSFLTSSSKRMVAHFSKLIHEHSFDLAKENLIIEIGCNDGSALAVAKNYCRVLGIDPARNVSLICESRGVPVVTEFFTANLAEEIESLNGQAHLIVACNVLGHVDNLDDFCQGIRNLLHKDGKFIFEVPYAREMVEKIEFDTIYHEHLSYFCIKPLVRLFNNHGLRLEKIEHFDVHGGTIRGTVVVGEACSVDVENEIRGENNNEVDWGQFKTSVNIIRWNLLTWLNEQSNKNFITWGYGAPAKGTVMLNYCEIGTDLLPIVVDCTGGKQNLYVPGTHQVIMHPNILHTYPKQPDNVLILAWNHAKEIIESNVEYKGKFVTPHNITGASACTEEAL